VIINEEKMMGVVEKCLVEAFVLNAGAVGIVLIVIEIGKLLGGV
jgi:hypothetical protein